VEHGDEAAAKLAGQFAAIAREVAVAHDGKVIELGGDEALSVALAVALPATRSCGDSPEYVLLSPRGIRR